MTFDYSPSANLALNQIEDKGRNVTMRTPGDDQVYDPITDTFSDGTNVDVSVKALFTDFSSQDIDGSIIQQGDNRLLIAGSAIPSAPSNNSKIIDGGTEYEVINTDTVQPGDTVVLYIIQVRS